MTESPLEELFNHVSTPWLESLGTQATLQEIGRICQGFSLDSSPCLVFECPIDEDTTVLDFSLELLAEGFEQLKEASYLSTDETNYWDRVRSYCEEYTKMDSLLGQHIAHTWLEYDTGSATGLEMPSLFMELDNSGSQIHRFSDDANECFEALRQGIEILSPSLSTATIDMLKQCGLQLPEGAGALGIGIMLARPVKALRFCANQVPVNELGDYLERLQWTGNIQAFTETLPQISGYEPRCRLAIDVSETIGDSIGVEIVAQPINRFRENDDWNIWLDALVERKLCTPARRDILAKWLGQSSHPITDHYTPDRIFRDISHLKFTFDSDGKVRTKAYPHASHLSGKSLQGWFLQQFENLESGTPPPTYPGL